MRRFGVGIVGCGEAAQLLHLPALHQLQERFEVTALCDVSPGVREGLGRAHPSASVHAEYSGLVRDPRVEVVLVTNPHVLHAETAVAALDAGKHVLIEKPMCLSLREADRLAEAQQRSGAVAQIGYMRRYAGAFLEAAELVNQQRGEIRLARFHDIVGRNASIVQDIGAVLRPTDLTPDAGKALREMELAHIEEAIGSSDPGLIKAYGQLLGLGSHDISAMRELLGRPGRVLQAAQHWGGVYIAALFDYGEFVAEFTTGVDAIPRYDTFIEIFGADTVIRVDYAPPYIRNVPAKLTVTRPHGDGGVDTGTRFPGRADPFTAEWLAFHGSLTNGKPPKTSIADSREDLEIFTEILALLKQQG